VSEEPRAGAAPQGAREGALRRLYHWVLGWADRPGAPMALVGIAAAESFFFPIPPDLLLIPMALGRPRRALRFALLCTLGSVGGGIVGYLIGSALYQSVGAPILDFYGYVGEYRKLGELYARHLVLTLGSAGFTPIPYKVFTIAAGVWHERVSLGTLVLASAIGRPLRFFLVAGLVQLFGTPIKRFIDKYFDLCSMGFVGLLVLGIIVVKWL
jgi:membrane protein YqaA with SNARE-associated domain